MFIKLCLNWSIIMHHSLHKLSADCLQRHHTVKNGVQMWNCVSQNFVLQNWQSSSLIGQLGHLILYAFDPPSRPDNILCSVWVQILGSCLCDTYDILAAVCEDHTGFGILWILSIEMKQVKSDLHSYCQCEEWIILHSFTAWHSVSLGPRVSLASKFGVNATELN